MSGDSEALRRVVQLCGEAAVDEFAHLPPGLAGQALAYAMRWHAITLEREAGDAAVLEFYAAVRRDIDAGEAKQREYMAKPTPELTT